jgi:hypothetical protein
MSILAYIFVSTAEDAALYQERMLDENEKPATDLYEIAPHKGFTSLEFGTLWALIRGERMDVSKHALVHISHGEEGEMWLEQFPQELIQTLSSLESPFKESIVKAWAATDEIRATPEDIKPVIEDLIRLARLALSSGRGMYLWGCL